MKRSKNLLLLLSSLILLTACSSKYVPTPIPRMVTLSRVDDVNVTTNSEGGLDRDEAIKLFQLVYKLRAVEGYYMEETTRLDEFALEHNLKVKDGEFL